MRRPEDEAPITIPNLGLEGRVSRADELRCRSPSGSFNELPNSPRMNARTIAPNVRLTNSSCSVSALERAAEIVLQCHDFGEARASR